MNLRKPMITVSKNSSDMPFTFHLDADEHLLE
jgi:hypothetical protein